MKLFRKQVYEKQSENWLGAVRLHRPTSFSHVAAISVACLIAITAYAIWGEMNRKARVAGLIVPAQGTLSITSPQAATITRLPVAEGQSVRAGDVLIELSTDRLNLRDGIVDGGAARVAAQIEARRQSLNNERSLKEMQTRQREQVLRDRIQTIAAELRQSSEECELQERRTKLAQTTVARYEQLEKSGFVSAAQTQVRQEELIDATARLQSLQRMRLGLQHDKQALSGELDGLNAQLKADLGRLDASLASLAQEETENTMRKGMVISAPTSGRITALGLHEGQTVGPGQSLLTFLPDSKSESPLQAQLFAPSNTAGFLRPGQIVYLRYAAYPYQKFGSYAGLISSVSNTPFAPNELPANIAQQIVKQAGSNEAMYRVNVLLDRQFIVAYGEQIPLKPGLTLEADVLLERRKIWEWIFEPLLVVGQKFNSITTRGD